jgi:hypothetical protein
VNWSTVIALLRTVLFGWAVSLWQFLRMLWRLLLQRRPPRGPEHRPTAPTDCTPIDNPAFVRPDPLLYSQRYLRDRGLDVTWDNPDIVLFKGGVPVSSAELDPATTYDVRVRVWNNSLEAPVVAMPVHLLYRSFGAGTQDHPIASDTVDVGVKGSVDQPGFVSIPWTTPATPGHYCLQAQLDPADDVEPGNNIGWENTNVVAAQSSATFTFELRNDTRGTRTYRYELDGYELPALRPCADDRVEPAARLERHRRGGHPLPDEFQVQITPENPTLAAGNAITVTVTAEPPAGFSGRQAINVNVVHDLGLAGGVTLVVIKEP